MKKKMKSLITNSVLNALWRIEEAIRHHKDCEGVSNGKDLADDIDIIKQYIKGERDIIWFTEEDK
jgi:hypothetical protein